MPEYMCVQCFRCEAFQVQQVKKVDKFTCRMCQASQSVRKIYAISAKAKDIRSVVVGLNTKRADIDSAEPTPQTRPQPASPTPRQHSQWDSFVTEDPALLDCNSPDEPSGPRIFVTGMPDKVQRKRKPHNDPEHCGSDPAGSKRSVGACVGLPPPAQAQNRTKAPRCTNSQVGAQVCKGASRSTSDLQYGFHEKAESHFGMQPASVSVIQGCGYQATLQQPVSMPNREPQATKHAAEPASIGRSRSTWSSFLDSSNVAPDAFMLHHENDGDVLGHDGAESDLVTALD